MIKHAKLAENPGGPHGLCWTRGDHEQDAASDFAVVFATAVESGYLAPFPQILIEEIQHLAILAGAADKHQQDQLHEPSRRLLDPPRRVSEREFDQGIEASVLRQLLLVARHPGGWH